MLITSRGTRGFVGPLGGHIARGFTLVELLATLFVITLLLTILVPRISSARQQAKRTVCLSRERSITLGLLNYANQNNDYLPIVAKEIDGISPREVISRPSSGLVNLGRLVGTELPDAAGYYCPSARLANFSRDLSLLGKGNVASDYVYGVSMAPEKKMSLGSMGSVALVGDNFVGSNLGKDIGLGYYSHRSGYNVTFADGSGIFIRDSDGFIAKEKVAYDDETDNFTFAQLDDRGDAPIGSPPTMRIYEVWHALSYDDVR